MEDRSLTTTETFVMQSLMQSDQSFEDLTREFSWDEDLARGIEEEGDYPSDYITEISSTDLRKAIRSLKASGYIRGPGKRGYTMTVSGARALMGGRL